MLNLAHFLDVTAERYPENTAVILDGLKMCWRDLASYARRVAGVLRSRGIGPGDTVALMIPNTPHFPMIYYGILHTGAAVVPVNVLYQRSEIEHYLTDSGAKAFFAFKGFEEEARKAFLAAECCKHFFVVSAPTDLEDPAVGENFTKALMAAPADFDTVQTMPDDTAVILYTSGTTGVPKGAELTHFNMFFNAYYACHHIMKMGPADTALVTLPLFHSFGQTCLMNASVLGGGTMTMLPRFETEKAMQVIARDQDHRDRCPLCASFHAEHRQVRGLRLQPGAPGGIRGAALPRKRTASRNVTESPSWKATACPRRVPWPPSRKRAPRCGSVPSGNRSGRRDVISSTNGLRTSGEVGERHPRPQREAITEPALCYPRRH